MLISSADVAIIFSAIAVLIGAYATYRNSTRKADLERLQARILDTEKRLADTEKRANDNERRANEYKNDVRLIGESIVRERAETARRLSIIVSDGNSKIQKVVIILEKVLIDMEAATGTKPDIDLETLKRLVVIDSVTGQLGPIDAEAVKHSL